MNSSLSKEPTAPTSEPPLIKNEQLFMTLCAGAMFLVVSSINMVAPLLVELANQFHTSVGAMGLLTAAGAIPWAVLAPFMGVLGDRLGRRPVVTAGLAALGTTTILSALAWDYNSLFFFRVLGAVGGATTGPNFFAATADYFPRQRRGRAMGVQLAGISLATVAGVPLTALLAAYVGWRWAFAAIGLCLVLVAVVVWQVFPTARAASSPEGYLSSLSRALTVRATPFLLAANMLERASFTALSTYLAAFLIQSYGLRLDQVAPALSATAAGTLLGSLFGGRLADRGKQALQFPLFQVAAASLVLPIFLFTPGLVPTALLAAAFGLTSSLARPAWMWLISRVPSHLRSATMGYAATTNQLGLMIGASMGGLLVGLGGYPPVSILSCAAALGAAALCVVGARLLPR